VHLDEKIRDLVKDASPKWMLDYTTFIPGTTPVYYSGPFFDTEELEATIKAFLTGKWLVTGEHVYKFQLEFAKKFGVTHAHMVNSGSSANLILITALKKFFKWNDGDEIIVSPVGFPTTIAPISQNNLVPVFADIEMKTLNFSIDAVRAKITPKTRAIFVSPVLGNPPHMDDLRELCALHDILLIGDNCDSLGTMWAGKPITDYYFAWTCSFYPAHHITTGEGGMICANDELFIDLCRSLSWWGRDCYCVGSANLLPCGTCKRRFDKWLPGFDGTVDHKYVFTSMGYNLKPLDMQGAMGLVQLKKIDQINTFRIRSKETISHSIFKHIAGARVAEALTNAAPAWFGVPIICDTDTIKTDLQQHFENHKIQTRNYFAGNILLHPGYAHLDDYQLYPNANLALSRVFFIGCAPHYTTEILDYIDSVCEDWLC